MHRNLQLLGIAKKAGLLAIGGEAVSVAAKSGRVEAILSAADTADGAKRRAQRDAEYCGAQYYVVPYSKFEIGNITGRGSPGTLAILDKGLAKGFIDGLAGEDAENHTGASDIIEKPVFPPGRKLTPASSDSKATGKRRTAL